MTYGPEAEVAVVGAMLLDPDACDVALSIVRPGDFTDHRLETTAAAARTIHARGEPVDAITVGEELHRQGALKGNLDAAFPHLIAGAVPIVVNVEHWARQVRDAAIFRGLASAGARIADLAASRLLAPADAVEDARALLDDLAETAPASIRPVDADLAGWLEAIKAPKRMVPTPWGDLNRFIGGLRPGTLTIVGARPGVGKTVVGVQLAAGLAQQGPTALVSLEMSRSDIIARYAAQEMLVPLSEMLTGTLTASTEERLRKFAERSLPLYVATADEVHTLGQLRAFVRSVTREGALQGVIVDYLQLLTVGGPVESRQQEVATLSRALKLMSLQLDVPIIALSQLNRGPAHRAGKKPALTDLRESGAIEQDADTVLLLHREDNEPILHVDIAKNRHGSTGAIELAWQGELARATTLQWTPTSNLPTTPPTEGEHPWR